MNSITPEFLAFAGLALLTTGASLAAVALRDIVHCGLCLALAFVGIAGIYLLLGAEFIGFIQLLVYVGAVAILIMFVILLTRPDRQNRLLSLRHVLAKLPGITVGLAVLAVLLFSIGGSPSLHVNLPAESDVSIEAFGLMLVSTHLLPLQIIAVLLTAALIGGMLFAFGEGEEK